MVRGPQKPPRAPRAKLGLSEIGQSIGISAATVSNALNGTGRVSAKVVARVREAAQAMGYVPTHAARALRTGRTRTLGLVLPNITNPLFPALAQAIEAEAAQRGYAVLLADSRGLPDEQERALRDFSGRKVEGVIMVPCRGSEQVDMQTAGIRQVAIIDTPSNPANGVSSDHEGGGRMAAGHLLDRGCRDFLLLAGPRASRVAADRTRGAQAVLQAAGVSFKTVYGDYDLDQAACALREWWQTRCLDRSSADAQAVPPAVLAVSDVLAVGVLRGAQAIGIAVPRELFISGFDDIVWASIVSPPLTSIAQDVTAIARTAVRIALGECPPGQIVPVSLVVRASTAPAMPDAVVLAGAGRTPLSPASSPSPSEPPP